MARYTDDSRERVRDAVDFVDLVGSRVELRKAGVRRYQGLCPFHDERSPSFGIDPVEKLYHCFGCGAGGDLFKWVMETEHVGFQDALELLADRYNVQLDRTEEDPRAAERRARRDRLHALLERTAAYYVRLLWESDEAAVAREYLAGRGLSEATAREFRVGFSPTAWDRVVHGSGRAGFTHDELLAAGLAQRARSGNGLVDRFRGRLMFPWADARGRVLGFGARALHEGQQPKYLNSAEGEVFHKGRQVYGAQLARTGAAKAGSVVLVEGYTDVMAFHQAGIRNTVGQMGTALTAEQAAELAKLAPTVLLCLDADAAGQQAMLKAAGVVRGLARAPELRVVPLPAGTDPADVVQRDGPGAVQALLADARPFARWQVEYALDHGDTGTVEGRDRLLGEVAPVVRALPPGLLREELVRTVAGRLGLSEGLAAAALGNVAAGAGAGNGRAGGGFGGAAGRARGGFARPDGGRAGAGRGHREGSGGPGPRTAPAFARTPRAGAGQAGAGPYDGDPGRDGAPAASAGHGGDVEHDTALQALIDADPGSDTAGHGPPPGDLPPDHAAAAALAAARHAGAAGHGDVGGEAAARGGGAWPPGGDGAGRAGAGWPPGAGGRSSGRGHPDAGGRSSGRGHPAAGGRPGRGPAPAGRPGHGSGRDDGPGHPGFAAADGAATLALRALDHRSETELGFLALCLALPAAGARRLASLDLDAAITGGLARRAAERLREHPESPAGGLDHEDPLSALMAELVVRAGALEDPQPSELDRAALMLELARLDRTIAAARAAQAPVSELAAERQRVLAEIRTLSH